MPSAQLACRNDRPGNKMHKNSGGTAEKFNKTHGDVCSPFHDEPSGMCRASLVLPEESGSGWRCSIQGQRQLDTQRTVQSCMGFACPRAMLINHAANMLMLCDSAATSCSAPRMICVMQMLSSAFGSRATSGCEAKGSLCHEGLGKPHAMQIDMTAGSPQ